MLISIKTRRRKKEKAKQLASTSKQEAVFLYTSMLELIIKNIQALTIEDLYKTKQNLSPLIVEEIFVANSTSP